jgi:hypothetical protein
MSQGRPAKILVPRSTRFELGSGAKRTGTPSQKPFDVLFEGLISENSRGDWTRLELFWMAFASGERACGGVSLHT